MQAYLGDLGCQNGNLTNDGVNQYLYDAEGRLCATQNDTTQAATGYVYDGKGNRLAKGTINSLSCDLTQNQFTATNYYAPDLNGEQLEEADGNFNFLHSNIFLNGRVLTTYTGTSISQSNWHFSLDDWLGTRRVQANFDGTAEGSFLTLPFGDNLTETGAPGATGHEFTSKPRDMETGNDYFGARYYTSNMGRFMTPDSGADATLGVPVPFAELENPQSLNLYSYARNTPLSLTDPDGQNVEVCVDGAASCLNCTDQGYQNLLTAQNGQQGINLPTGSMPNGGITCGGQTCGTATFFEPGAQDETGRELMGIAGGMAADYVIGKAAGL